MPTGIGHLATVLFLSAARVAGASSALTTMSHCEVNEITYFSCPLKHSLKIVSLCGGSLKVGATDEVDSDFMKHMWLQYRFGKRHKLELVFPKQASGSLSLFLGEHYQGQSASGSTVRFVNGATEYSVGSMYSAVSSSGFEGVTVTTKGMKTTMLSCDGAPTENINFGDLVKELEPAK